MMTNIDSADTFYRLRTSDNPDEYNRATHGYASETVWRDVIRDYPDMKQWVVLNKTVPTSILAILANDKDEDVRRTVAMKRKLTRELFDMLMNDNSENVRYQLTWNKKLPVDMLQKLAKDRSVFVRHSAIDRLEKK